MLTVYALSDVVVIHHLSADRHTGTYLPLIGGVVQVILLTLFHDSLRQIVLVQIGIMSVLFVVLMIWDRWVERQA